MTVRRIKDVDKVSDLVDRLRLDHAARARGAVVVEGPTDAQVLARALGIDERQFFPVNGRQNVLRVADQLNSGLPNGVICVADRDFDEAADRYAVETRIVFTDNGDLEAMLTFSTAFTRVLQEWGSAAKLSRIGGEEVVRDRVFSTLTTVSILRRANASRRLGLVFDAVDLHDVVVRATLELRQVGYLDRVARASGTSRRTLEESLGVTAAPECPATGTLLVRGRDAYAVVEVALTRVIGTLQPQQAAGLVERSVRLAVTAGALASMPFSVRFASALSAAA